jgi:hypothetical protein
VLINGILLGSNVPQFGWEVRDHILDGDSEITAVNRIDLAKSEVVNLRLESVSELLPGKHLGLLSEDPLLTEATKEDKAPSKVRCIERETEAFTFVDSHWTFPGERDILPDNGGCEGGTGDQAGLGLQDKPVITLSVGLKSGDLNCPCTCPGIGPVV